MNIDAQLLITALACIAAQARVEFQDRSFLARVATRVNDVKKEHITYKACVAAQAVAADQARVVEQARVASQVQVVALARKRISGY